MSSRKIWFIFILFFLLTFSYLKYEPGSYSKSTESPLTDIEQFLKEQVNKSQLFGNKPYYWRGDMLYSVVFDGQDVTQKIKKKKIDLYLNKLALITGLKIKEVNQDEANVRFYFSNDWRNYLIENSPEYKKNNPETKVMSQENYKKYWMKNNNDNYIVRQWDSKNRELVTATLFFNYQLKKETCSILTNIARILMLNPHKVKSYKDSCREEGELPFMEEAFLSVYYGNKYQKLLKNNPEPDREQIKKLFLHEMVLYIDSL